MTNKPHRENAEAARSAAAASELPNVRERNLRSARAHDAVASQDEDAAANLKVRQAETAARRIGRVAEAFDEDED